MTARGKPKPDPTLRDYENVPLPTKRVTHETDTTRRLHTPEYQTAINDYLETEVHPYVPDAWHDPKKTKIGYEIPLTRHFYTYTPPRPLKADRQGNQDPRSRNPGSARRGNQGVKLTKIKRVPVLRAGGTPSVQAERFLRVGTDPTAFHGSLIGDMPDGGTTLAILLATSRD